MRLKISFPAFLCPFGKKKNTPSALTTEPQPPETPELETPNADIYIVSGIIILMILILLFWAPLCHAQQKVSTGLKIGDQVPDITITNMINYPAKTAKISDFKGKLLILDFWATWCSPCVAMIPKMDSLQKEFEGKVQFLPVAYQTRDEVNMLMDKLQKQQKRTYNLPDVVEDKVLIGLFPHSELPHFVWINERGMVKAITDQNAVNAVNIGSFLKDQDLKVKAKTDIPLLKYDRTKPLFNDQSAVFDSALIYHSVFSGYIEGLRAGYHYDLFVVGKPRRITVRNSPILSIFCDAYSGQYKNLSYHHLLVDVKDSTQLFSDKMGQEYKDWGHDHHAFCYELIVPPALAPDIFQIMQADLTKFFPQYKARVETIDRTCWVLTRTSTNDKIHSLGGTPLVQADRFGFHLQNATLDYLLVQLDSFYLSNQPYPVIDGTGYHGKVDLTIDANLGQVDAINKALEKYELKFVLKKAPVEVLHISDRDNSL